MAQKLYRGVIQENVGRNQSNANRRGPAERNTATLEPLVRGWVAANVSNELVTRVTVFAGRREWGGEPVKFYHPNIDNR
jgi:hypothetical protein